MYRHRILNILFYLVKTSCAHYTRYLLKLNDYPLTTEFTFLFGLKVFLIIPWVLKGVKVNEIS